jgi:hypothetical protein
MIMKASIYEHGGCFELYLAADTMEEAAKIVRFGVNHTKEIRHCSSSVTPNGTFVISAVFGKLKLSQSNIPTV